MMTITTHDELRYAAGAAYYQATELTTRDLLACGPGVAAAVDALGQALNAAEDVLVAAARALVLALETARAHREAADAAPENAPTDLAWGAVYFHGNERRAPFVGSVAILDDHLTLYPVDEPAAVAETGAHVWVLETEEYGMGRTLLGVYTNPAGPAEDAYAAERARLLAQPFPDAAPADAGDPATGERRFDFGGDAVVLRPVPLNPGPAAPDPAPMTNAELRALIAAVRTEHVCESPSCTDFPDCTGHRYDSAAAGYWGAGEREREEAAWARESGNDFSLSEWEPPMAM